MSDETTLRECPFCGGEVEPPIARKWTNCLGDKSFSASMRCHNCNLKIMTKSCVYETEEMAIAAMIAEWNTRAICGKITAQQVQEAIERRFDFDVWVPYIRYQYIADELNAESESDDEYEAKMDALLSRLTNGKWSKSRSYDLDFMESCVNEEFEMLYSDMLADEAMKSSMLTAEQMQAAIERHSHDYYGMRQFLSGSYAAIADDLNAELESEPSYDELLSCLENDWHIRASWDGLRKFWCIELTEEGVELRDAAHSTLTAEQIRKAVEGHGNIMDNRLYEDWQAVADELNAELESVKDGV